MLTIPVLLETDSVFACFDTDSIPVCFYLIMFWFGLSFFCFYFSTLDYVPINTEEWELDIIHESQSCSYEPKCVMLKE